jgi:hypothetical protein
VSMITPLRTSRASERPSARAARRRAPHRLQRVSDVPDDDREHGDREHRRPPGEAPERIGAPEDARERPATSSTSVVGTRRSSDTSARRTTRMPSPIAHSAAMMVRSVPARRAKEVRADQRAAKTARVRQSASSEARGCRVEPGAPGGGARGIRGHRVSPCSPASPSLAPRPTSGACLILKASITTKNQPQPSRDPTRRAPAPAGSLRRASARA